MTIDFLRNSAWFFNQKNLYFRRVGIASLRLCRSAYSTERKRKFLIRINKEERAIIYKAYPELKVPRTVTGKYWLSEEEKYLRLLPDNEEAARLCAIIDKRRERMRQLDS